MNRKTNREIPCDWRVVKVRQETLCDPAWRREKGIVACGVYVLVDANLHVHICSLTPSLEAWALFGFADFTNDEEYEKDQGETESEMLNSEEEVTYYDTEILEGPNRPLSEYLDIPEQEDDESDENYRRRVAENAREYFCGNPCSF